MDALLPYLNTLDALTHTAVAGDGEAYVGPALKNLGVVTIPIIREVIAPAVFRNEDPEITDIEVDGVRRVRAVANKFKFGDRARGLQVLRLFGAGGRMPQNRTDFTKSMKPSDGYDLNTVVFGDSANKGKFILPVKAAVTYSDAISLANFGDCVEETFHNRASEDGSLFDAQDKKNSDNIFDRHFVRPGTLLLQILTLTGKTAPPEAIEHLLVAIGLAGAYGGQTSIYGINVCNHVVGLYAGRLERPVSSPYVAVHELTAKPSNADWQTDVAAAETALDTIFTSAYPVRVGADAVAMVQKERISGIESGDTALAETYRTTAAKVGAFFNAWFEKV
jgi:CRISPR type I-D-associated protein Csc2